jgi:hypothetical protein
MDKEKERFLRIYFKDDSEILVDVNSDIQWEKILSQKKNIAKIESMEWLWDLVNNKVVFQ